MFYLDWCQILISCLTSSESEIFAYLLDAAEWNEKLQKSILSNIGEILIHALQTRSMMATNLLLDRYGYLPAVRRIQPIDLTGNNMTMAEFIILKKSVQRFNFTGKSSCTTRRLPLSDDFQTVNNVYNSVKGNLKIYPIIHY